MTKTGDSADVRVSQYYLKVLGGNTNVSHLASIAGANHGTTAAGACLVDS